MKSLGKHLVIELYGCDTTLLDDPTFLERTLLEGVNRSGATIIQPFFHQFSPHGVTGVVVLAESHVAVHTWPEFAYCALDIFTCGTQVDPDVIYEYIRDQLVATDASLVQLERGTLDLPCGELRHKPSVPQQAI